MSRQIVNEYRLLTSNVVGDVLSITTALFLTTDGRVGVPLQLIIHRLRDAPWNSCFLQGKLFDNLPVI